MVVTVNIPPADVPAPAAAVRFAPPRVAGGKGHARARPAVRRLLSGRSLAYHATIKKFGLYAHMAQAWQARSRTRSGGGKTSSQPQYVTISSTKYLQPGVHAIHDTRVRACLPRERGLN